MLSAGEIESLKNDLRDFYNNFPRYTTLGSFKLITELSTDAKYIKYIMKYLEPYMNVLDVGMGSGVVTMEMARIAQQVTGVDIADRTVDFANKLKEIELRRYKLIEDCNRKDLHTANVSNVSCMVSDVDKLSFKDKTFDLIVAIDLIEHLPAPIKSISEMLRCLKVNGILILMVHTPNVDVNLNIESWKTDIFKMKNKDVVFKINFNILKRWFKKKNIQVLEYDVIYNSKWLRLLTKIIPQLKGAQLIEKYEDEIIFVLNKRS